VAAVAVEVGAVSDQVQQRVGLSTQVLVGGLEVGRLGRRGQLGPLREMLPQALHLCVEEVTEQDVLGVVGQVALELRDGHRAGERRVGEAVECLEAADEVGEELVGGDAGDDLSPVLGDEAVRRVAEVAVGSPEQGVASDLRRLEGLNQGVVPVAGPTADDEAVLVEDASQQTAHLLGVAAELLDGVELVERGVVAVQLHHGAACVSERFHPLDGGGRGDDLRHDPDRFQRLLDEAVEVRRNDDPHGTTRGQLGHGSVRGSGDLASLLAVLLGRLEEPGEQGVPCSG
jgi:hypothetical protein